ncbi:MULTISPECIES: competence/damage-inducible protein A [Methylomonas]|uniref:Competence/damage-inducible protein A n=2 Tax=Methylomonas TaxID=416 RepID=A0A126T8E8_9GAMM|nr:MULTISPECIES: molybdopterin-binding protein [Methylomonas]AMK78318.1 competence/damage-inducible protein A [Methylomonas denitrificans]OAI04032.1 competence/damage-inducible protein A [Methylomonas methanica]TCV87651.1 molybdenum cofactor synthesis domain-containing protein/competence/damage-inducible protein CinA-like protein [Methylomonas methanica]
MKQVAEIFSQGEEIVCGQTVDSNAAWLSQQLVELGFTLKRHTAVGDNLEDLIALFTEIAGRADCCICTGGLGPTIDDLTAEAVSIASGQPLQFDAQVFAEIQEYYARRNRAMPEANRKQAMLPQSAVRIDNAYGTAPGFALQFKRCWFVFLPGVPSEMKQMFTALVRLQLLQRFPLQPDCLVTLRSIGIGESAIQQCLDGIQLPEGVQLGFRAAPDEVQTKLLFPGDFPESNKQACVADVAERIGAYVFAMDGLHEQQGDLLDVVAAAMSAKRCSLALMETASQGLLAAKCLGHKWLARVEVNLDWGRNTGAWSGQAVADDLQPIARVWAEQLKAREQTDFALVQLYSGSAEDYSDKDKTIVLYNALATPSGVVSTQLNAHGPLKHKQNQAALLALDLLRRYLQNKCL